MWSCNVLLRCGLRVLGKLVNCVLCVGIETCVAICLVKCLVNVSFSLFVLCKDSVGD